MKNAIITTLAVALTFSINAAEVIPAVEWTVPRVYTNATGKILRYRWAEPKSKEPGRTYPLVVLFHGAGERGTNNVAQLKWGATELLGYMKKHGIEGYFIAGQVPEGQQWVNTPWSQLKHDMPKEPSESMGLALELIDTTIAACPVDRKSVLVTGISMGGYGTWDAIQRRPELFAAAMPICGGGDVNQAERIRNVPIWVWHGDADTAVPVQRSRDMYRAVGAFAGNIRYTEVFWCGHAVWTPAYANGEALDWFFSGHRLPTDGAGLWKSRPAMWQKPTSWPVSSFERNGVKAVMIEGERYRGRETRFFAYYGLPEGTSPEHKVPGIVLVHGGAGTAFDSWVRTWNSRGYAAIAMDNCGGVPPRDSTIGRLVHNYSGPDGWGCYPFVNDPKTDQWSFHAISTVIRSHSFLRSLPEVDASRIGVTGISWGGYLTACVAGIDDRFVFASPVYGCAYLRDHSCWSKELAGPMGEKWNNLWDASKFLPQAKMPMLWCNGSNDHFFPIDSWQRGYRLTQSEPQICCKVRMPHAHPPSGDPQEITTFADHIVFGKPALPKFLTVTENAGRLSTSWKSFGRKIVKAELVYTKSTDANWEKRLFETMPCTISGDSASVEIPDGAVIYWVNISDVDGNITSSAHVTVGRASVK